MLPFNFSIRIKKTKTTEEFSTLETKVVFALRLNCFHLLKTNKFISNKEMNQFGTPEQYFKVCDRLSRDGYDARLYQSPEVAIYDLAQSLIHFMPHKNKIAVISHGSHLLDVVTSLTLRNQNQIVYKKENENTIAFLETLGSNIHFVYWASENEVTGEVIYSDAQCEEIRAVLNRKKIFSLQVTNRTEITPQLFSQEVTSFTMILKIPNIFRSAIEATVAYYSEKQKINFGLSALQQMEQPNSFIHLPLARAQGNVLVNCENALQVKEYLKLSSNEAFVANEFPSWITDKWIAWWPEITQPSVLKGLLVLSTEYVALNPEYLAQVRQAEVQIKELAVWKI
jgi:hypothetical protein